MMHRPIFRSVTTVVGAAVVGAAVAIAGVVGATELTTPTASVSSSDRAPAERAAATDQDDDSSIPCGASVDKFLDKLPDALVADLEELRDVAPDQRREALEDLRDNARDGKYGDRAQEFVESGMLQRMWRELPRELRSDLLEIVELPNAQIPGALMAVLDDAASGAYGDRVQFIAERIQEHVEECDS